MPPNANGGRTEAMHLIEELENRLALSSMNVPAVISAARIAVVYHDHAVARGVVERLQDDLSHILQQAQPLFKAGFAATDPVAGQAIAVSVGGQAGQLIITVKDAVQSPMLLVLLLYLVAVQNQTPPGAYERLLAVLDGDEDAAQDAFSPLNFSADVARIALHLEGQGTKLLNLHEISVAQHLEEVLHQISNDGERQLFAVGDRPRYDPEMDDAFLTLQNTGVFSSRLGEWSYEAEPEIFLGHAGMLVVDGWCDRPVWLAELVTTISNGYPPQDRKSVV